MAGFNPYPRLSAAGVILGSRKEAYMASKTSNQKRKTVRLGDQSVIRGEGGETHQNAGGDVPQLTTQQGMTVSDDQNTLKIGSRGPAALEDFHFREKIFHDEENQQGTRHFKEV
jgi:Catalase